MQCRNKEAKRHDISKGQDEAEPLSPIIGDKTDIHNWYHDERIVRSVGKAPLKPLDVSLQIY